MNSALADPAFPSDTHLIFDRRKIEAPTVEYVKSFAKFLIEHEDFKDRLLAIVVSDAASLGMARMAQILVNMKGLQLEVFTDIEAARSWIIEQTEHGILPDDVNPNEPLDS